MKDDSKAQNSTANAAPPNANSKSANGAPPKGGLPVINWRKRMIWASVVVGGFAFMLHHQQPAWMFLGGSTRSMSTTPGAASGKSALGQAFSGPAYGHPFFVPKHPGRLFPTGKDKESNQDKWLAASQRALLENQYSLNISDSDVMHRLDHVSVASNEPCEDRHSEHAFELADGSILHVFGMFDGHSGFQCADSLRKFAPTYIRDSLAGGGGDVDEVLNKIQSALVSFDNDLLATAMNPDFVSNPKAIMPALAGAVSTVAVVHHDHLFIANTGDVRGVMGSSDKTRKFTSRALSIDHTASNEDEVKRICAEHPKEAQSTLLYRNRILGGLMPTRAFGDASYKWFTSQLQELGVSCLKNGNGEVAKHMRPIPNSKTPPYVTAKPEMFHYKLLDEDQFIILATDGLWDSISNDEAVDFVSRYPKEGREGENAAAYLVRKALEKIPESVKAQNPKYTGEMYCAKLLSIPPPYSRNYRDDITVTVVFLRDEYKTKHKVHGTVPVQPKEQKFPRFEEQFDKVEAKL